MRDTNQLDDVHRKKRVLASNIGRWTLSWKLPLGSKILLLS